MYYARYIYPSPYYFYAPMYNDARQPMYWPIPYGAVPVNRFDLPRSSETNANTDLEDYGKTPFVININEAAKQNRMFRTAVWTGKHLQVTLMSINVGEDIGLEVHPDVDQFFRIEEGQGVVRMGDTKDNLTFERPVNDDTAIMIPAGTWHNIINTGNTPLKLYSIYAPPQHPFGTVHKTKADAMAAE